MAVNGIRYQFVLNKSLKERRLRQAQAPKKTEDYNGFFSILPFKHCRAQKSFMNYQNNYLRVFP